ncbi:MAG: hypothetical protein R3C56_40445 [Pirellulaceae bacterium]
MSIRRGCLVLRFVLLISLAVVDARAQTQKDVATLDDATRVANQKKLLEFVLPENRTNPLRESLTESLLSSYAAGDPNWDELKHDEQRAAIVEARHERLFNSTTFIDAMLMKGRENPQLRQITKRAIDVEVNSMLLELQKASYATSLERHRTRIKNKLASLNEIEIAPLSAATGSRQNFLLEAMQGKALEYGYSVSQGTELGASLMQIKLSDEDLSKIRIKTLAGGGGYVSFGLLEGSGTLGQLPFVLRSPQLSDEFAAVDGLLSALAKVDGQSQEFFEKTTKLRRAVEAYEAAFLHHLGNAQAAAHAGVQSYATWTKGRDYIRGLKATLNCLELEGNPAFFRIVSSTMRRNTAMGCYRWLPLWPQIVANSRRPSRVTRTPTFDSIADYSNCRRCWIQNKKARVHQDSRMRFREDHDTRH